MPPRRPGHTRSVTLCADVLSALPSSLVWRSLGESGGACPGGTRHRQPRKGNSQLKLRQGFGQQCSHPRGSAFILVPGEDCLHGTNARKPGISLRVAVSHLSRWSLPSASVLSAGHMLRVTVGPLSYAQVLLLGSGHPQSRDEEGAHRWGPSSARCSSVKDVLVQATLGRAHWVSTLAPASAALRSFG